MTFNYTDAIKTMKAITPINDEHASDIAKVIARFEGEAAIDAATAAERNLLISAGRVARAVGFTVKASKDRSGKVSSFYATKGEMKIRISDHVLPENGRRAIMGLLPEIIVTDKTDVAAAIKEICAA